MLKLFLSSRDRSIASSPGLPLLVRNEAKLAPYSVFVPSGNPGNEATQWKYLIACDYCLAVFVRSSSS